MINIRNILLQNIKFIKVLNDEKLLIKLIVIKIKIND